MEDEEKRGGYEGGVGKEGEKRMRKEVEWGVVGDKKGMEEEKDETRREGWAEGTQEEGYNFSCVP